VTAEARRQLAHYRILSRIGAGGMGEVFLAEDEMLAATTIGRSACAGIGRRGRAARQHRRDHHSTHDPRSRLMNHGSLSFVNFGPTRRFLFGRPLHWEMVRLHVELRDALSLAQGVANRVRPFDLQWEIHGSGGAAHLRV
jgi:hypothetical protein